MVAPAAIRRRATPIRQRAGGGVRGGGSSLLFEGTSMANSRLIAIAGLAAIGLAAAAPSIARTKAEINASADTAVKRFYALNVADRRLVDKAAGVLVFGRVSKGGAGVGGEFGEGVLRVRGADVSYYSVAAASAGLTRGLASHSAIILFMTQESLDNFMRSERWSAGTGAGIVLVKTGADGKYATDTIGKPVLGFIFHEKGQIGDLSFEGTTISKIKSAR